MLPIMNLASIYIVFDHASLNSLAPLLLGVMFSSIPLCRSGTALGGDDVHSKRASFADNHAASVHGGRQRGNWEGTSGGCRLHTTYSTM